MDGSTAAAAIKQHLIDPEVCIRCNTCEATCPVGAVTHDDNNYVVDASTCNFCMACVPPCPTGSIDHWFQVSVPFTVEEQFGWTELPPPPEIPADAADSATALLSDSAEDEAASLLAEAHARVGGRARAPRLAARPQVNLHNRANPARARVAGNIRVTRAGTGSDAHHIILDFGATAFPVLEGQSVGLAPPGTDGMGKPHAMRLYSVSSPRDGEKPGANSIALTVKRVAESRPDGTVFRGVASNWLCDLRVGDEVPVVGPFGTTFLMPDDPDADLVMVCTGTGAAPFRGFTERRRRLGIQGQGKLHLFFGARTPEELPYFGPLQKVPAEVLAQELVYSRLPGQPKEYVQDRMRAQAADLAALLQRERTHVYVCGLKGLEAGVDEALTEAAILAGQDWPKLRTRMREEGRFHAETY